MLIGRWLVSAPGAEPQWQCAAPSNRTVRGPAAAASPPPRRRSGALPAAVLPVTAHATCASTARQSAQQPDPTARRSARPCAAGKTARALALLFIRGKGQAETAGSMTAQTVPQWRRARPPRACQARLWRNTLWAATSPSHASSERRPRAGAVASSSCGEGRNANKKRKCSASASFPATPLPIRGKGSLLPGS